MILGVLIFSVLLSSQSVLGPPPQVRQKLDGQEVAVVYTNDNTCDAFGNRSLCTNTSVD